MVSEEHVLSIEPLGQAVLFDARIDTCTVTEAATNKRMIDPVGNVRLTDIRITEEAFIPVNSRHLGTHEQVSTGK